MVANLNSASAAAMCLVLGNQRCPYVAFTKRDIFISLKSRGAILFCFTPIDIEHYRWTTMWHIVCASANSFTLAAVTVN